MSKRANKKKSPRVGTFLEGYEAGLKYGAEMERRLIIETFGDYYISRDPFPAYAWWPGGWYRVR